MTAEKRILELEKENAKLKEELSLYNSEALSEVVRITTKKLLEVSTSIEGTPLDITDDKKGGEFDRFMKFVKDIPPTLKVYSDLAKTMKVEVSATSNRKSTGKLSPENLMNENNR